MLLCHCAVRWKQRRDVWCGKSQQGWRDSLATLASISQGSPAEEETKAHTNRHLLKPLDTRLRQQHTTPASCPIALKCLAKHTSPGNFHHAQHLLSTRPNWHTLICTLKTTPCSAHQIEPMKICWGKGEKINRAINVVHRQLASRLAYVAYTERSRKEDDALVGILLNNNLYSLQLAPLRHNE